MVMLHSFPSLEKMYVLKNLASLGGKHESLVLFCFQQSGYISALTLFIKKKIMHKPSKKTLASKYFFCHYYTCKWSVLSRKLSFNPHNLSQVKVLQCTSVLNVYLYELTIKRSKVLFSSV